MMRANVANVCVAWALGTRRVCSALGELTSDARDSQKRVASAPRFPEIRSARCLVLCSDSWKPGEWRGDALVRRGTRVYQTNSHSTSLHSGLTSLAIAHASYQSGHLKSSSRESSAVLYFLLYACIITCKLRIVMVSLPSLCTSAECSIYTSENWQQICSIRANL